LSGIERIVVVGSATGAEAKFGKDGLAMKPLIVSLTTLEIVPVMFVTSLSEVSTVNCPFIDSEDESNVKL
jgi:hypothetical protein